MASPAEIIEKIRRKRFLIGLNKQSISDEVNEALQDSIDFKEGALSLASDLNTVKPHFKLELLQNAEDNDYKYNVIPKFKIIIDRDKLIIQNNEMGFTEENVDYLCRIGKSSKLDKTQGYIGEKGIGFKSVFLVSKEVHIYSNGFQFKFQYDETEPVSMIKPHWIEELPDFIDMNQTNIVLYLKKKEIENIETYADLEPYLLLFLRKLKKIEIENKMRNKKFYIEREDKDGIVILKYNTAKDFWKTISKTFQTIGIEEEKRKGVKETEIILAFPLNSDESARIDGYQKVFAYLPVKDYGFKFIIQADFLLQLGREDIHKEKDWNKKLIRDNIASVFIQAVEDFKRNERLKKTYYDYIPLEEEIIEPFFSVLVSQIYDRLREFECILTEDSNWRKPEDVFIVDYEVKSIISNKELKSFSGKEYISSKISTRNRNKLFKILGCKKFDTGDIIDYLESVENFDNKEDHWFIKLYEYLVKQNLEKEHLEVLRKLKIIRLANNEMTSINEGNIFFPFNFKDDYSFGKELRLIKSIFFEANEKELRDKCIEFLKKIGIRESSPYEIIEKYILPIYKSGKWKDSSITSKNLLDYIRFIKDNLEYYKTDAMKKLCKGFFGYEYNEEPLKELKENLFIRVDKTRNQAILYEKPEEIYLSKNYGNDNDLEYLFEGINDVFFIHKEYYDYTANKYKNLETNEKGEKLEENKNKEISEWKQFFITLGVNELPRVIYYKEQISGTDKKYPTKEERNGYYEEEIKDWKLSKEFEQLLLKNNDKRIEHLLRILNEHWFDKYKKALTMRYIWSEPKRNYKPRHEKFLPSSFIRELKEMLYLPATTGDVASPSDLFLNKKEITELLNDSVLYLNIELNKEFSDALEIRAEADLISVLIYLRILVDNGCMDIKKFKKLYNFLNENFEYNVENIFKDENLIFIPETTQLYFNSKEVLWKDFSNIFRNNRAYLERHYSDLKEFFIFKLKISEKPDPEDYGAVLEDLSTKWKKDHTLSKEDEQIILKIYGELNHNLSFIVDEDWWKDFINKEVFWVHHNKFCCRSICFINDIPEVFQLFKKNEILNFLKLPENYYPKIKNFIKKLGIPYLSEVIKIELTVEEDKKYEEEQLTEQIKGMFPYIFPYLYKLENEIYEEFKKEENLRKLNNFKCYSMDELDVRYELKGESAISQKKVLFYEGNLYVQKNYLDERDCIAIELSNIFKTPVLKVPRGLDDFIISLFDKKTDERIKKLLEAKGIHSLPESELLCLNLEKREDLLAKPGVSIITSNRESYYQEEMVSNGIEEGIRPDLTKSTQIIDSKVEVTVKEYYKESDRLFSVQEYNESDTKREINRIETEVSSLYPDERKITGRLGEEIVYKIKMKEFKEKYPEAQLQEDDEGFILKKEDKTVVKVIWNNKIAESGKSYDLKLIENTKLEYIEVKTTKSPDRRWFDVSYNEWLFAHKTGEDFYIYHVCNAGEKDVSHSVFQNPYKLWLDGKIRSNSIRIEY